MKRLTILLTFFWTVEAHATHWLTYYVYVETEYLQGPWVRTGLISGSDYRYLAAKVHEDLFGAMKEDLALKMLERLGGEKPELYDWECEVRLNGDTICLEPQGAFDLNETVLNEVTATLTLNGFAAVCFTFGGKTETYSLADLTLPYFDLVQPDGDHVTVDREAGPFGTDDITVNNPLAVLLFLSVLLNLAFALFLIFKPRR